METEEEEVLVSEDLERVCSCHEEFVPEKKRVLEKKKEALVSEDLERVCSSLISRDENPIPKRVTSAIQEAESVDSH